MAMPTKQNTLCLLLPALGCQWVLTLASWHILGYTGRNLQNDWKT